MGLEMREEKGKNGGRRGWIESDVRRKREEERMVNGKKDTHKDTQ